MLDVACSSVEPSISAFTVLLLTVMSYSEMQVKIDSWRLCQRNLMQRISVYMCIYVYVYQYIYIYIYSLSF